MSLKSVKIWRSTGEKVEFRGNDLPDDIEIDGPFVCFQYYKQQKTVSYYAAIIDQIEVIRGDD